MKEPDQISLSQFQDDLDAFKRLPRSEFETVKIQVDLLRERKIPIRNALRQALAMHFGTLNASTLADGAQEYNDILAGDKIYQETQES